MLWAGEPAITRMNILVPDGCVAEKVVRSTAVCPVQLLMRQSSRE
jgi:hypothetical protein